MSRIRRTQAEYDEMKRLYDNGFNCWPPTWWRNPTKEERKQQEHEKVMEALKKRKRRLTYNEGKFIEGMAKGLNQKDSAIFAGYAPLSASAQASRLMQKEKIIRELDKVGLTDKVLANVIKKNMEAGTGIKATADTSLKAVELALKLKGHLHEEKGDTTNIQVNDLRNLTDEELRQKLEVLQGEVIVGEPGESGHTENQLEES